MKNYLITTFFILFFITTFQSIFSMQEKATSIRKWSAMGLININYSSLENINTHIDTSIYNLVHNYNFLEKEKSLSHILLGSELSFFYHIKSPFLIGLGFGFDLNYPGSFKVKKENLEEYFSSDIKLGIYLVKLKLGSEFLRLQHWFVRGFLALETGIGQLNIKEVVFGIDFGESRENNYKLYSVPIGVEFLLDFVYRYNVRNGIVFGLSVSMLSFSEWTGENSLGQKGILLSIPLSNDYNKEIFVFHPGVVNDTTEKTTSFLITEIKLSIGYWQSI